MSTLVDTAALYALADRRDERHQEARDLYEEATAGERLLTTDYILVESWVLDANQYPTLAFAGVAQVSRQDLCVMFSESHISQGEIQEYADQIAARFKPERIILFGSAARNGVSRDSDVDLLVLMEFEGAAQEQAFRIRRELPRAFPLDLLVRRPAEAERRARLGDLFLREILEEGTVLHG